MSYVRDAEADILKKGREAGISSLLAPKPVLFIRKKERERGKERKEERKTD